MKLFKLISNIGNPISSFIMHIGALFVMLLEIVYDILLFFYNFKLERFFLLIKEVYYSGYKSITITLMSGWFVGMVLGLQGYNTLERFGSVTMLGSVVALSLLRELAPVLTAILFVARAGSGMSAEIGLMKATEQLDAMELMAVNPVYRILMPKFVGGVIAVPLLTALFNVSGIFGGYFVGVVLLKLDSGAFWSQMQSSVQFHEDILNGIIKSFVFGVFVTLIALYQGIVAKPTAEGISIATTKTVVFGAMLTLGLDFIMTAFMFK